MWQPQQRTQQHQWQSMQTMMRQTSQRLSVGEWGLRQRMSLVLVRQGCLMEAGL